MWREAGPGQLALYKVAQKTHVSQFLETCVPWRLECWVWEFPIAVFQVCAGSPAREAGSATPCSSHLGLHIRGEVQCVPLQFCEGNGGVLQVVEEDLDLCHNVVGPDVRSRREVCFALHFRGSQ